MSWALLGASRGLGFHFLQKALQHGETICAFSRKTETYPDQVRSFSFDFSKNTSWVELFETIRAHNPRRLIYFAGGGPHGAFQTKAWKDHQWAFKVTYECPSYLLHRFLAQPGELQQFTVIGSSIAESQPDPLAASYSSAKHALKGLINSIQKEQVPPFDLRLFSPGYLDTALLPIYAWPRQRPGLVKSPAEVSETLWDWIHNADDVNAHCALQSSYDKSSS